jgi:hypothetical protein
MRMRTANLDDLDQILILLKSETNKTQISENCIKQAIKSKEVIISILEGEENKIIGVMLGYQKSFLKKDCFKNDEIIQKIFQEIRYDFIYITNLIITNENQGKSYERMLIMSFLDDSKKNTVLHAISHAPKIDQESKNLFSSFKFKLEFEISVYNGLTFGIYEHDN